MSVSGPVHPVRDGAALQYTRYRTGRVLRYIRYGVRRLQPAPVGGEAGPDGPAGVGGWSDEARLLGTRPHVFLFEIDSRKQGYDRTLLEKNADKIQKIII